MIQYKLIKTYPGSPKLGYITKEGVDDGILNPQKYSEFWQIIEPEYIKVIDKHNGFTKGKIYTWPKPIDDAGKERIAFTNWKAWSKYFEEATKEEYDTQNVAFTVLSFKGNLPSNDGLFYRESNNTYCGIPYTQMIRSSITDIYSIQRKSDGEIFTIGDKVAFFNSTLTITKIITDDSFAGGLKFETVDGKKEAVQSLNTIAKAEVVFTAEDGLVYLGEPYWFVWTRNPARGQKEYTVYYVNRADRCTPAPEARFFTKEASAVEYVKKHRPTFTTNDNYALYDGNACFHIYKDIDQRWKMNTLIVGNFFKMKDHYYFKSIALATTKLKELNTLFVTEDGKSIEIGDYYWNVTPDFVIVMSIGSYIVPPKNYKQFSTTALAEKYVFDNKPVFSRNDLHQVFVKQLGWDSSHARVSVLLEKQIKK